MGQGRLWVNAPEFAGGGGHPGDGSALRRTAIAAAGVSLAVLTAAACALSYPGMHDLAAKAGVPPDLVGMYPVLFDALLVITGCSVLALRGAGLPSRVYAWVCLVLVLAGLAAGGAAASAGVSLPQRPAEAAAAIIPWLLVLIGLILLLLLVRYARVRRTAPAPDAAWLSPLADADAPREQAALEYVVTAESLEPEPEPLDPELEALDAESEPLEPEPPALLRQHSSPTPPGT